MSDTEALAELAKALDHISKAEALAEAEELENEINNLSSICLETIDAAIDTVADHEC